MKKTEKKVKTWTDHQGNDIPLKYISNYDKQRERISRKLLKTAKQLNKMLEDFKKMSLKETDEVRELMFSESGMEAKGKGNYTLTSFDKSVKIEISINDVVDFDDRIQVAQQRINDYLEEKSAGADHELMELVNNAFKTTKGRLDKARIFGLFQLSIKHPLWLEAMELIKNSIVTNSTRRYIQFWERDDDGQYHNINLNFSSL